MPGKRRVQDHSVGLTGTGYFDMNAYTSYLEGKMSDHIPTDEELQKSFDTLPKIG